MYNSLNWLQLLLYLFSMLLNFCLTINILLQESSKHLLAVKFQNKRIKTVLFAFYYQHQASVCSQTLTQFDTHTCKDGGLCSALHLSYGMHSSWQSLRAGETVVCWLWRYFSSHFSSQRLREFSKLEETTTKEKCSRNIKPFLKHVLCFPLSKNPRNKKINTNRLRKTTHMNYIHNRQ